MLAANSYLQHVFISQLWNKQLTVKSKFNDLEYKSLSAHIDFDNICYTKEYRNERSYSYGNKLYFIELPI